MLGASSKRRSESVPLLSGQVYINPQIPLLSLREGSYVLTLNLAAIGEIHEQHHCHQCCRFDVVQYTVTTVVLFKVTTIK